MDSDKDFRGDLGALDHLLASATTVHVHDGGNGPRGPMNTDPVLVVDGLDLIDLRRLLLVSEVLDARCMCLGTIALDVKDRAGIRITTIGVHHGQHIRWDGWDGDAVLVAQGGLGPWLADRGHRTLLDAADRSRELAERSRTQEHSWRAHAPEAVTEDLLDALIAGTRTGVRTPDTVLADLRTRLCAALPNDIDRCAALCRWHASGSGLVSGFPMHEETPNLLLCDFPLDVLVRVVLDGDATTVNGAARHLAGWKTRSDAELRAVPTPAWDRMIEAHGPEFERIRRLRGRFVRRG